MLILLFFAFISGFITIMSPCIWPLLPIIISASSVSGKQRPLGITLGIMTSFTIFTLSIAYFEKIFHIDPNLFRIIAVIAIIFLGLSMMAPSIGLKLEGLINKIAAPFRNRIKSEGVGFTGGYVMGFATGLVWAPCSGPILATVATLAATQEVNIKVAAVTLAYVFGLGIPLFIFSLAGSWCFNIIRRFTKYTARIQQAFGLVMIIAALLIYTNYDKIIQLKILDLFPSYGNFLAKFETDSRISRELAALQGRKETERTVKASAEGLPDLGEAPDFAGIAKWLNTPGPLTMAELRGKVVLVDFWTYTCINCVRTLPYLTAWYEKYRDNNFVIIGVHSPEFAFEKETRNVENAIKQFKINYPVALDNDFETWRVFDNQYWPTGYLIDTKGRIRKIHVGEGDYDEMEQDIRQLLEKSGNFVNAAATSLDDRAPRYNVTPETYLGLARLERFISNEQLAGGRQIFTHVSKIARDHFAYEGAWEIFDEAAISEKGSSLEIHFKAEKVFLVINSNAKGGRIKLLIDGRPVNGSIAGSDVKDSRLVIDTERLYNLIDLKGRPGSHILRLEFQNKGISVYAFTFG